MSRRSPWRGCSPVGTWRAVFSDMTGRFDHKIRMGLWIFLHRIIGLMKQPIFIAITILGNSCILIGTLVLYSVEHDVNPKLQTLLDAIWWAVATVSTVGYGDISPVTPTGKVIGIGMMIIGAALFSTYTALFAGALVTAEIGDMVTQIEKDIESEEQTLHRVIKTVESALVELHALKKMRSPTSEKRRKP